MLVASPAAGVTVAHGKPPVRENILLLGFSRRCCCCCWCLYWHHPASFRLAVSTSAGLESSNCKSGLYSLAPLSPSKSLTHDTALCWLAHSVMSCLCKIAKGWFLAAAGKDKYCWYFLLTLKIILSNPASVQLVLRGLSSRQSVWGIIKSIMLSSRP